MRRVKVGGDRQLVRRLSPLAALHDRQPPKLPGVLRASFWLTALLFIPLGLLLYFLPPVLAGTLGVAPLWLPRVAGGLVLAWGAFQVAAGFAPDAVKVGGLAGGNLLTVAALLPAALRDGALPPAVRTLDAGALGCAAAAGGGCDPRGTLAPQVR